MKKQTINSLYLQRGITPEQINKEGQLQRSATFERVLDQEKRTVEMAFSSEAEVERWFGIEVLDHSPGAMRTDRLSDGGPLLINHDWDDQIGVVESVSVDADRRGRAVVRFGRGHKATEIFQDVVDNIRRHVSVAYLSHKVEVEERAGLPDMVRVLDWEPYEISIVSVPADTSVGVGRSLENSPEKPPEGKRQPDANTDNGLGNATDEDSAQMNEKILRDDQGNLVRALVDDEGNISKVIEVIEKAGAEREAGARDMNKRVSTIMEMADKYEAGDLARQFLKDGNTDPQAFQRQLLDHINERSNKPLNEVDGYDVGMNDDEVRQFSFLRALRALANPTNRRMQEAASFEYEASRAAAEKLGRDAEGIMVPPDVLRRALNSSTSGSAAGDTGGYSIETELLSQSFIELLRNRSVLLQLGRPMAGLVGNLDIPRQASGATGYWIGEDEDAPEDTLELDQVGLTPKTVAALSEITRRLMMQSSLDVEALVRSDLARALALTIDSAGFYGTGASNQPLGIANTTGVNAVDLGGASSGGTGVFPTYAEVVEMESEIAADNADVDSMAYVFNSRGRGHFKTTQKFTGTNGNPIWEPGNTVNGYRTEVTNQILNQDVFFGNFADLLFGMWGGLDLTIDPYTHSSKGRLRIVAMQDVDFALRRVESFCLGRDVS